MNISNIWKKVIGQRAENVLSCPCGWTVRRDPYPQQHLEEHKERCYLST